MARAPYGHAVIFHEHQQVETEMLRYEDEYDLQNSHGSMQSQRIRELEERIARDDAYIAGWHRYRDDVEESWHAWYEQRCQAEQSAADLRNELLEENAIHQQVRQQYQELQDKEVTIADIRAGERCEIAGLLLRNEELVDEFAEAKTLLAASIMSKEEMQQAMQYPLLQEIVEQRLTSEELLEDSRVAEFHLMLQNSAVERELAEAKTLLTASFVSEEEMQRAVQSPFLQEVVAEKQRAKHLREELCTTEFRMNKGSRSCISSPIDEPCKMIKHAVSPRGTVLRNISLCKRRRSC